MTMYLCIVDVDVFESATSGKTIRTEKEGTVLTSSGKAVNVDGFDMIPVLPSGAVQCDYLQEQKSAGEEDLDEFWDPDEEDLDEFLDPDLFEETVVAGTNGEATSASLTLPDCTTSAPSTDIAAGDTTNPSLAPRDEVVESSCAAKPFISSQILQDDTQTACGGKPAMDEASVHATPGAGAADAFRTVVRCPDCGSHECLRVGTPILDDCVNTWMMVHAQFGRVNTWMRLYAQIDCLSRQVRGVVSDMDMVEVRFWYLREHILALMIDENMLKLCVWMCDGKLRLRKAFKNMLDPDVYAGVYPDTTARAWGSPLSIAQQVHVAKYSCSVVVRFVFLFGDDAYDPPPPLFHFGDDAYDPPLVEW